MAYWALAAQQGYCGAAELQSCKYRKTSDKQSEKKNLKSATRVAVARSTACVLLCAATADVEILDILIISMLGFMRWLGNNYFIISAYYKLKKLLYLKQFDWY